MISWVFSLILIFETGLIAFEGVRHPSHLGNYFVLVLVDFSYFKLEVFPGILSQHSK